MTTVQVRRYSGCCGSVSSYDDPEEPGLLKCDGCGKIDYSEAFEKMELREELIECEHCKETTKHELTEFDWWSGITVTVCGKCYKNNIHTPDK
jgi:hypothetical protein